MARTKLFNDPLYGFISPYSPLVAKIIEHRWFQRLRRIKQLGLTDLVYPGAHHTRFQHAMGAAWLMQQTLQSLRQKGYSISDHECESTIIAMLLHDIGHGPFSHVLEYTLLEKVHHETLSLLFMKALNEAFDHQLDTALQIFNNTYPRRFLHQLVSSQLDIDRLDYLNRDSYFTGVSEGIVSAERIIHMLEVVDDEIAIAEKGIYSVEDFLNARRLMYWQVYLHKTTICAEEMLIQIVKRAKYLHQKGIEVPLTPHLKVFFDNNLEKKDFEQNPSYLEAFGMIDDYDIWSGIKQWQHHPDYILSLLCTMLLERRLFKIKLYKEPIGELFTHDIDLKICDRFSILPENLPYLRVKGVISNYGYISSGKRIKILKKNQTLVDISEASDLPNIKAISEVVKKYYICTPRLD